MQDKWTAVDTYFTDHLVPNDNVLDSALKDSDDGGLPAIAVAPNQGKLLMMMAQMCGAKKILEIGTLGGYSTIWLARALPADGELITLEYEQHHADVASKNIERAGFANQVEIRVGAAVDTLPILDDEGHVFDFIFIDANKDDYPAYLDWSIKLSRKGTTIFADNVVRGGEVANPNTSDIYVQGAQGLIEMLNNDPRLDATAIQTVGSKGYDGFALAIVL